MKESDYFTTNVNIIDNDIAKIYQTNNQLQNQFLEQKILKYNHNETKYRQQIDSLKVQVNDLQLKFTQQLQQQKSVIIQTCQEEIDYITSSKNNEIQDLNFQINSDKHTIDSFQQQVASQKAEIRQMKLLLEQLSQQNIKLNNNLNYLLPGFSDIPSIKQNIQQLLQIQNNQENQHILKFQQQSKLLEFQLLNLEKLIQNFKVTYKEMKNKLKSQINDLKKDNQILLNDNQQLSILNINQEKNLKQLNKENEEYKLKNQELNLIVKQMSLDYQKYQKQNQQYQIKDQEQNEIINSLTNQVNNTQQNNSELQEMNKQYGDKIFKQNQVMKQQEEQLKQMESKFYLLLQGANCKNVKFQEVQQQDQFIDKDSEDQNYSQQQQCMRPDNERQFDDISNQELLDSLMKSGLEIEDEEVLKLLVKQNMQ